ncbi:hypothetical protein [Shinella zoogloeoides]|uniref:Uncharacterized protein n=1 Tax=Shinella zoogloeoides TaxID=352475 RepID=A0A6N8TMP0_SHIZO|nr:hypothetical protein [Shinella zoogloeoides]MXO02404.1 hypothetical protein [Shinella zoogloeoides]UEX80410.1 hypothetical protein K8M09_12370 [Shinella zoogloeoides]
MVAIVVFLFLSGRSIATSMGVVRPGTIGPAPEGLERSGRRLATAFLPRDAKPKAAEKSWRRTLRETSEAKPVFGQTHANRDRGWSARFRKSGEYGNGGRPYALTLENGNGVGFAGRCSAA